MTYRMKAIYRVFVRQHTYRLLRFFSCDSEKIWKYPLSAIAYRHRHCSSEVLVFLTTFGTSEQPVTGKLHFMLRCRLILVFICDGLAKKNRCQPLSQNKVDEQVSLLPYWTSRVLFKHTALKRYALRRSVQDLYADLYFHPILLAGDNIRCHTVSFQENSEFMPPGSIGFYRLQSYYGTFRVLHSHEAATVFPLKQACCTGAVSPLRVCYTITFWYDIWEIFSAIKICEKITIYAL